MFSFITFVIKASALYFFQKDCHCVWATHVILTLKLIKRSYYLDEGSLANLNEGSWRNQPAGAVAPPLRAGDFCLCGHHSITRDTSTHKR